jgi:hypothetical protein
MEIDIGALGDDDVPRHSASRGSGNGHQFAPAWEGEEPVVAVETEPPEEYEVRVFDLSRERRLVAALELVNPANKDRPESRHSFVAKCAALLRNGVAVSLVGLVTLRRFNLYAKLMNFIGHPDPTMSLSDPATYAATCRWATLGMRARLEAWSHAMVVGKPLPTIPLWPSEDFGIPLDLEPSYEQACHELWIE